MSVLRSCVNVNFSKKRLVNAEVMCGAVLLLSYLLHRFSFSDYLSSFTLIFYLVYIFAKKRKMIWKYIYIYFYIVSGFVSILVCEMSNIYLWEIGINSKRNGAAPPLIFYYWLLSSMILFFDEFFFRANREVKRLNYKYGYFSISGFINRISLPLIFVLNCFLLLMVIKHPFFSYGVGRFQYAQDYMPEIVAKLYYYPIFLSPLAVMAVDSRKDNTDRKKLITLLVVYTPYLLFSFWIGAKFSLIWILFYCILVPGYELVSNTTKSVVKSFKNIIIIVVAFLVIVISYYYLIEGSVEKGLMSLYERTSMQSQLWWRVFGVYDGQGMHLSELSDGIKSIVESISTNGGVREYGVYKLMNMFGDADVVQSYLYNGVRFSAQGIELAYYYLSDLALFVVPIIRAFLFVLFTNMLYVRTKSNSFLEAYLCCVLLINLMSALSQGDFFVLFTTKSLLSMLLLLLCSMYVRKRKNGYYMTKKE